MSVAQLLDAPSEKLPPSRFAVDVLREPLARQFVRWGEDVRAEAGNRLVAYGFERIPCPGRPGCSRYGYHRGDMTLALWGWGLALHAGGPHAACLHRRLSQPMTVFAQHIESTWFAGELPIPLGEWAPDSTSDIPRHLHAVCQWIGDYEAWVAATFRQERRGPDGSNHESRESSASQWHALAESLAHEHHSTAGGKS
jgi:hypothetical protein